MASPTALVTGIAGFLGSHVAEHCLDLGFHVVGVDDLSGGFQENVPPGTSFCTGSISDPKFVEQIWQSHGPFEYVFHLAAYAAEGLSHFIRRFNYTNNVVGSVNLINEAASSGVTQRFVFTSSIAVYGSLPPPMSEDMTPHPEDPYGISKYAVELDLAAAQRVFGLDYTVFRPHNVYGERQNIADPYRNVIGIFMNALLEGRRMPIFGDGSQTRAFTHVDDVAPVIARSVLVDDAANETFNVGADRPYSVLELARRTAVALGLPAAIEYLPPRDEVRHAFSTHEKALDVLHAVPIVDLDSGLQRMAEWVRREGSRPPSGLSEVEVRRRLPPSWSDFLAAAQAELEPT